MRQDERTGSRGPLTAGRPIQHKWTPRVTHDDQQSDRPNGAGPYLRLDDAALLAQCEVDVYRASGPGGQKRNKTCSAVRLRHTPTGLMGNAVEDRSQHSNKRRAIRRLRETIALSVRTDIDPGSYEPSACLRSYLRAGGPLKVSTRNEDYPCVVAEVLDVLTACEIRVSDAASLLTLNTAHLVGFFEADPHLWKRVNELRRIAGEKPLR